MICPFPDKRRKCLYYRRKNIFFPSASCALERPKPEYTFLGGGHTPDTDFLVTRSELCMDMTFPTSLVEYSWSTCT